MTATGCGTKSRDDYDTPHWCVRQLLRTHALPGGRWLEPASGTNAIVESVGGLRSDVKWTTIEICSNRSASAPRNDSIRNGLCGNYLDADWRSRAIVAPYDVCITNPPYGGRKRLAEQFVKASLYLAHVSVFLLRLNWISGGCGPNARSEWLAGHMPAKIYVLAKRPSFDGSGTDACEYAWMLWQPPFERASSELQVITPISWDFEYQKF